MVTWSQLKRRDKSSDNCPPLGMMEWLFKIFCWSDHGNDENHEMRTRDKNNGCKGTDFCWEVKATWIVWPQTTTWMANPVKNLTHLAGGTDKAGSPLAQGEMIASIDSGLEGWDSFIFY